LKLYTLAKAQKLCGNQGEFNMPKGKGTYGTTVGRPPKKKKVVKKPKKKGSY
jgi:hypothetical protein